MMCGGLIFNALVTVVPKWFDIAVGPAMAGSVLGVGGFNPQRHANAEMALMQRYRQAIKPAVA